MLPIEQMIDGFEYDVQNTLVHQIKRHAFTLRQEKGEALKDISMVWAFRHRPVIKVYGGTL